MSKAKNMQKNISAIALSMFIVLVILPLSTSAIEGPKITATLVNTDPDPVRPGENFDVRIKFENTGDETFQNAVVFLKVNSPFSVIGENERSIGTLGAQQRNNEGVIVRFIVHPDKNTKQGTYDLSVGYLIGREGRAFIELEDSIIVDEINQPSYLLTAEEGNANNNVVVGITNNGKSNLSFVSIKILESEDYTVITSPVVYIGSLESDDFDSADFSVIRERKNGENPTKEFTTLLEVTFTDEFDNQITNKEELNIPLLLRETRTEKAGGSFLTTFLRAGIGILFILFAIFMLADNFKEKRSGFKKLLWTIVILTLIGTPIYYFVARNKE